MKKLNIIFSIIIILFIAGCDQVNVISPKINYQQYFVIRAELKAGNNFEGVTFTKTLPIDESYDIKKAELTNVTAFLVVNKVQMIPLHYTQDGIYKALYDFNIEAGDTYELYARENNTSIYSITQIPYPPKLVSAQFSGTSTNYVQASVTGRSNEILGISWIVMNPNSNNVLDISPDFQNLVNSPQDTLSTVTTVTMDIPDKYNTDYYRNSTYVQVFSFDTQYLRYFESRKNNQPISNTFTEGGGQIAWNVQGNNVIGLFIGMAESNTYRVIDY